MMSAPINIEGWQLDRGAGKVSDKLEKQPTTLGAKEILDGEYCRNRLRHGESPFGL